MGWYTEPDTLSLAKSGRIVIAPPPTGNQQVVGPLSVTLKEGEDVIWNWTHRPGGSYVHGYTIIRK